MITRHSLLKYILPFVAWMVFKTFMLLLPIEPSSSGGILSLIPYGDKIIHTGIFGMSAGLFTRIYRIYKNKSKLKNDIGFAFDHRTLVYVLVLAIIYSVGIEFLQTLIPGRGADFFDVLANLTGVLICYFTYNKVINWPFMRWVK